MRRRLFLALLGTALASIALVVTLLRTSTQHQVRAFMAQSEPWGLQAAAQALADFYTRQHDWRGVEPLLALPHGPGGREGSLLLADPQGRILAPAPYAGHTWSPTQRNLAVPIRVDGRVVGYVLPPADGHAANAGRTLLHNLDQAALLAALLTTLLAAALAWALSRHMTRPIHALMAAARRLAAGDLQARVPETGDAELASLARAFNHMAAALQQAEATRQRLLADIAHELRTPLAVQQAHLEALQDGVYPLTPANLAPVVEQNRLLARLIEDLRTLTLMDAGRLPLHPRPLALVPWLQAWVEGLQATAHQHEVRLETHWPADDLWVRADPERLEQILHNLAANALRYTPPGGRIEIGARSQGDRVQVWLRDTGPGLPPGEETRIFERFYRVDKSRARASGGSGLGLSIARGLARAMGGDLTAANHPDGGAQFTLHLPRIPAPDEA